MGFDAHKNFAYSTVATAPSPASSGTSLVVAAGQGALFPAVPFNATVWPAGAQPTTTNAEVVRVTAISTDTLTIIRQQEGTSARSVVVGDQIANTSTVKVFTDIEAGEPMAFFENIYGAQNLAVLGNITVSSKRPLLYPFWMEGSLSQLRSLGILISRSNTSNSAQTLNITGGIAFYSATNSTQLSLYQSETYAVSITTTSLWSGVRELMIAPTNISSATYSGGLWWLGLYFNGSNDSTAVMNFSIFGLTKPTTPVGSLFSGTNATSATNNTNQLFQFAGSYSTTEATNTPFPSTIAQSDVTGGGTSGQVIYFRIIP